jgi:FkbM family methyltransferase
MQTPRFRGMVAGMLGHHLTATDLAFLRAIPDGLVIDLDAQRTEEARSPGLPSVLWSMLWEASAARALGDRCLKRVQFRLGDKRFTMELDLAESPECGYILRNPTVRLTGLLAGFAGKGRTMLDVGANAGFHALTAGLFFRRVIAFEPTPATAARLERNIMLSALRHIDVKRCALSNREGEATFAINDRHCGANRLGEERLAPTGGSITVPLRTLDGMANEIGRVDFIKIDVEGHECEVLEGARKTVEQDRPLLFVEFNRPDLFERFRAMLPRGYVASAPGVAADGTVDAGLIVTSGAEAVAARDVLFGP